MRIGAARQSYAADEALFDSRVQWAWLALLGLALVAFPFVANDYWLYLACLVAINVASATGLNILTGYTGLVSLGQAAFMGLGAYTVAVLEIRAGTPALLNIAAGGFVAMAGGVVVGIPSLRVKGLYLAISTLAMQYLVDYVIIHVPAISGGTQATLQAPPVRLLGIALKGDAAYYWFVLGACMLVTLFMLNVRRTSYGRALAAIREKDYAAEIIGVSTFRYKLSAFWVSSFIGGVAGALFAFCYYKAVTPEQFHLELSIQLLATVIVGGLGSVLGSFFGAALILLAPVVLNNLITGTAKALSLSVNADVTAHAPLVLYGALIVGFLLFEPLGLAKIYDNLRNYFLVWPFRHARR